MQCVILAGGLGTRLRPCTENVPKSMVRVLGKPFLEYQIDLLSVQGVTEIVLCVGYLHQQIEDYFKSGEKFGINISYSYEKEQLLGTAGALKNAGRLLCDEFFVMYGDSYPDAPFQDVYRCFSRISYPVLMTVYKNKDKWVPSNVVFREEMVEVYDKKNRVKNMEYIDYGVSVFSRKVLEEIPGQIPYNLANLFEKLSGAGRLAGYEVFRRFYEIGSERGLKEFEDFMKKRGH